MFVAVAREGSFSGAAARLNVSAATVSTQVAALEERLGVLLCERGRGGFRLTAAGHRTLRAAEKLFLAHDEFANEVALTRRRRRPFRIGVIDSVIDNTDLKLSEMMAMAVERLPHVEFNLFSMSPSDISESVQDGDIDVGIGVFFQLAPGLIHAEVIKVDQYLYCSRHCSLLKAGEGEPSLAEVQKYPYVARTYTADRQLVPGVLFSVHAYVASVELAAVLIRSGRFIGHLPGYLGDRWTPSGEMKALHPDRMRYTNQVRILMREAAATSADTKTFIDCVRTAHRLSIPAGG